MNDVTRKRAQRVIERQVADGSMTRLGDGKIIERDRRAQQTASQAVIMTSTTGHGAHLIAIWSAAPPGTASLVLLMASPLFLCGGPTTQPGPSPPWLLPPSGCVRPTAEANVPTPHRRRGSSRVFQQSNVEARHPSRRLPGGLGFAAACKSRRLSQLRQLEPTLKG